MKQKVKIILDYVVSISLYFRNTEKYEIIMNVVETIVKSFFTSKCDSSKFDEFVNGDQVNYLLIGFSIILKGTTYRHKT